MSESETEQQRVLGNAAVMAVGTLFSRMSGFVRSALLAAALGNQLHADLFTIANTIPNMLYILLAGGVVNAVLVPQLVRSMRNDRDGGEAYTSRIVTLAAMFLGLVTVVLVVAAPYVMDVFLDSKYDDPALAEQRDSIVAFARFCLPQVFFYGMYVLVGQILNARGSFGPMMWAPIANNLLSVVMLVVYLVLHGTIGEGAAADAALTTGQEVLLGAGSTLGIAAQLAVLVPYLRRSGFTYRPRFDFRDPELKHTLRLGVWTVLFVVVTQTAYLVVVKLASGGTTDGGTGYTVYATSLLVIMVPHSVVTVSLATAILPRISALAHDADLAGLGTTVGSTLRTALAFMLPFGVLVPFVADDLALAVFGWGRAGEQQAELFGPTIAVFAPALAFFTVHYFMLRGFYAMEMTKRVFFIQVAVSLTNVVVAVLLVSMTSPDRTAPMLALAYLASYVVGSAVSFALLSRHVGGLEGARLLRFAVRMALVLAVAAGVTWASHLALGELLPGTHPLLGLTRGAIAGLAGCLAVLLGARLTRVDEVTSLTDTVVARLRRG